MHMHLSTRLAVCSQEARGGRPASAALTAYPRRAIVPTSPHSPFHVTSMQLPAGPMLLSWGQSLLSVAPSVPHTLAFSRNHYCFLHSLCKIEAFVLTFVFHVIYSHSELMSAYTVIHSLAQETLTEQHHGAGACQMLDMHWAE